jgi:hypothetical protein
MSNALSVAAMSFWCVLLGLMGVPYSGFGSGLLAGLGRLRR